MEDFFVIYVVGVIFLAAVALMVFTVSEDRENREAASVTFFASFVWPAAFVYWLIRTVIQMFRLLRK